MKYYFITYQATNRQGTDSIWNQVINTSPMEFIKGIEASEYVGSNTYYNFVVLNTCEISEDEFNEFNGRIGFVRFNPSDEWFTITISAAPHSFFKLLCPNGID